MKATTIKNNAEYTVKGKRHREDGPAFVTKRGSMFWYKDGMFHREDGPAVIHADGTMCWYQNGISHREDGPAIVYPDGQEFWCLYGKSCDKYSLNNIVSPSGETLSHSE